MKLKRVNPRKPRFSSELTGAQLRAARALLNMSAERLAEESNVSLRTIRRAEQDDGPVSINAPNAERLIQVLEGHGVIFSNEHGLESVGLPSG